MRSAVVEPDLAAVVLPTVASILTDQSLVLALHALVISSLAHGARDFASSVGLSERALRDTCRRNRIVPPSAMLRWGKLVRALWLARDGSTFVAAARGAGFEDARAARRAAQSLTGRSWSALASDGLGLTFIQSIRVTHEDS